MMHTSHLFTTTHQLIMSPKKKMIPICCEKPIYSNYIQSCCDPIYLDRRVCPNQKSHKEDLLKSNLIKSERMTSLQ